MMFHNAVTSYLRFVRLLLHLYPYSDDTEDGLRTCAKKGEVQNLRRSQKKYEERKTITLSKYIWFVNFLKFNYFTDIFQPWHMQYNKLQGGFPAFFVSCGITLVIPSFALFPFFPFFPLICFLWRPKLNEKQDVLSVLHENWSDRDEGCTPLTHTLPHSLIKSNCVLLSSLAQSPRSPSLPVISNSVCFTILWFLIVFCTQANLREIFANQKSLSILGSKS
ncbi:hypothetical protein EGR_07985 [Echinococcus granulosus]|uniref:Uncharacterized protein n=1 Tax=Echinococcus granulosus TaxID=6210 RepID=W6U7G0_ECHGR|nr:hypothetical protein EGR_07985 [Echinococcus granulosus]EUB57168.1 hypothetical protein EGR_07985 [Echinococcus granulosus]